MARGNEPVSVEQSDAPPTPPVTVIECRAVHFPREARYASARLAFYERVDGERRLTDAAAIDALDVVDELAAMLDPADYRPRELLAVIEVEDGVERIAWCVDDGIDTDPPISADTPE